MYYGIIVDGYSSGAELVFEFNKLGIQCLHIQSTKQIPNVYINTFNQSAYIQNFILNNNLEELTAFIKQYNPLFIIPGSEPGVELADILANNLSIPTCNPISTSVNRRNKFLMHEQLKQNNLAYMQQLKSASCDEIINWADKFAKWPVVMKPLKSAGGDKVKICYSKEDIIIGFNQIVTKEPNLLTLIDEEVLIQEYVDAPEIAVNTVQYEGKSYLSEIVQFHKILINTGHKIYDYANLMPFNSCNLIIDYAFKVAKALDINYGPMHAEIFLTTKGPVLIEAAARIMGANIPLGLMKNCLTHPQAYMTTLAYSKPKEFLLKVKNKPKIKKNLRIVFLISNISGTLAKINHLQKIRNLRSFFDIKLRIINKINFTIDYDTSPGLIYLCHEDERILNEDYLTIRKLEKNNMYEVY